MKKRIISLFLVIGILAALLPVNTTAAALSGQDLKQQIRDTYRTALRKSGYSSFSGFCGAFVSWQTYLLGIDTSRHPNNGKDIYDQYANRSTTCGGYRVKSYPASRYTMKEALNAITDNGTTDVYNLVVGFQKTNTTEGRIYGHAVFIHGIVDGTVYFMESYDSAVGGKYWEEGSAISCSIDAFCRYYGSWTVFDGIAVFGLKNYANVCTAYPTNITAIVTETTPLLYEPVDVGVNEEDATELSIAMRGDIVTTTELLKTPGGSFWYRIALGNQSAFLPASAVKPLQFGSDDLTLTSVKVPNALRKGNSFVLGGTISTTNTNLSQVQVVVQPANNADPAARYEAVVNVSGKQFSLSSSSIDKNMPFRKLPAGDYRIAISATTEYYTYEDGQPVLRRYTKTLWLSYFRVTSDYKTHYTVTFQDADEIDFNSTCVLSGAAITTLPQPSKPGHTFVGWYTKATGGEKVTEDTIIKKNTTLYAHWEESFMETTGWVELNGQWYYGGEFGEEITSGWFTTEGIRFYRDENGNVLRGWAMVDKEWYYFSSLGAAQTGWLEDNTGKYYMNDDGIRAYGWQEIGGKYYYFSETGQMLTGWQEIDGNIYYLHENGARAVGVTVLNGLKYNFQLDGTLRTGWIYKGGKHLYLDETGAPITGWHNIDGVVYYFGDNGELYLSTSGTDNGSSLISSNLPLYEYVE